MTDMLPILQEAAKCFENTTEFAEAMGRSRQGLYTIKQLSKAEALLLEYVTDGKISRHRARPDKWPRDSKPICRRSPR